MIIGGRSGQVTWLSCGDDGAVGAVVLRQGRPQWAVRCHPAEHRVEDRGGHPAEGRRVLMSVDALAQIDLGHGVQAVRGDRVQEQCGLYPVPGGERQRLQQRPPAGVLPRERLHDPASSGRNAPSSGRAISSVTRPPPAAETSSSGRS